MDAYQSDGWARGLVGALIGGRYRVDAVIGAGGMGAVLRASHTTLGRQFALKVLRPTLRTDPESVERFQREARLAGAAGERGVVEMLDFAVDPRFGPYLVMELLEGESLEACIRRKGRLSPHESVAWVARALDILAVVHAQGVLHRDLKPANLFLERTAAGPQLKLLDFGLSRLAGAAVGTGPTVPGRPMGTPWYMAPEQLEGRVDVDHRTDVFGAGATLYACLTGIAPRELVLPSGARGMSPEVVPIGTRGRALPPPLVAVVERALAADRDARFPDAAAMASALRAALPPAPQPRVEAAREPRANASRRGCWLVLLTIALVASLGLAGTLALALLVRTRPEAPPPRSGGPAAATQPSAPEPTTLARELRAEFDAARAALAAGDPLAAERHYRAVSDRSPEAERDSAEADLVAFGWMGLGDLVTARVEPVTENGSLALVSAAYRRQLGRMAEAEGHYGNAQTLGSRDVLQCIMLARHRLHGRMAHVMETLPDTPEPWGAQTMAGLRAAGPQYRDSSRRMLRAARDVAVSRRAPCHAEVVRLAAALPPAPL